MAEYYSLIKALHIISFTAWMAGMFYLPRLFAYHAEQPVGSPVSEQFKIMERRLLRAIINPAMISTFLFGGMLYSIIGFSKPPVWFELKFVLVISLTLLHAFFSRTRRKLARDERPRSARFYKIINELVTVIFIGIVLLVMLKPF